MIALLKSLGGSWEQARGDLRADLEHLEAAINQQWSTALPVNRGGTGTTAAVGVPATVAIGRSTTNTAAVASVATVTDGATDASYFVVASVLVTTSTTHNFTVTAAYTDESSSARTLTLTFSQVGGTLAAAITNALGAGPYMGVPLLIRCKASTPITIATTGTFTTVTYHVEGRILQV